MGSLETDEITGNSSRNRKIRGGGRRGGWVIGGLKTGNEDG